MLPEDGAARLGRRQARGVCRRSPPRRPGSWPSCCWPTATPLAAIEVCRAGLAIDRFADPLWRLLLRALDADDDPAGHARAGTEYDAVLAELGVTS